MRKIILFCFISVLLMGCGNNEEEQEQEKGPFLTEDSLMNNKNESQVDTTPEVVEVEDTSSDIATDTLQVEGDFEDLTILPDILLQSQINRLSYAYSQDDIGTQYKVKGIYAVEQQPMLGLYFEILTFYDDTGCCTQILEIEIPSDMEAPVPGQTICLIGEFKVKEIDGIEYPYLDVSDYE